MLLARKLQDRIETQRTLDTPYGQRPNFQSPTQQLNTNLTTQRYADNKRRNFTSPAYNENCSISIDQQNKKNLSISHQYNEHSVNHNPNKTTSKHNRSLAHQQQHSKSFNSFNSSNKRGDRVLGQSPNVSFQPNNTHSNPCQEKKDERSNQRQQNKSKSLSKKTEMIRFNKISQYLQEVRQRKVLDDFQVRNNRQNDVSLVNLSQQQYQLLNTINYPINQSKQNITTQPKLNVQVCLQYLNFETSNSMEAFRYKKRGQNSRQQNKENKSMSIGRLEEKGKMKSLFPKSGKFLEESGKGLKDNATKQPLNNDYYCDYVDGGNAFEKNRSLPINAKTLNLSQKFGFRLDRQPKSSQRSTFQTRSITNFTKKGNNYRSGAVISMKRDISLKYNTEASEYVSYRIKSSRSSHNLFKKTEPFSHSFQNNRNFKPNVRTSFQTQSKLKNDTQNFSILLSNIPENILIQQQDLRSTPIIQKSINLDNYGFQSSQTKSFKVKPSTRTFICKYCLEIFNIYEIRYHKGRVCNIAHKESEFVGKIRKLSSFLFETFEGYYQSRSLYEVFRKLSIMLLRKLEHLQNEQKFAYLARRIQAAFYQKQNYDLHIKLKPYQKDRFFIQKVEEILHLEEIIDIQKEFTAVYGLVDLGRKKQTKGESNNTMKGPVHLEKVVVVGDLFWLVRKLFEGLVLIKIKHVEKYKSINND